MSAVEDSIPMDETLRSFGEFISQDKNKRIFLSGKFGSGKTFFLKEFLRQNAKQYDPYYLFPIRYQIFENEDVINLIKYDILVSIFERGLAKPTEVDLKEKIKRFSKYLDWNRLIESIPKLGRHLRLTKEVYAAWREAGKDPATAQLEEFQESMGEHLVGSLDILLQQQVQELKGENKQSVLVLDDLDRMDPEHIFRMLNILSARMEVEEENELGFDRVVLVGDVDNIRHIFHHKYGQETDFRGYFDKFFTIGPYELNNERAILNWIQSQMVASIDHDDSLKVSMESNSGYLRMSLEALIGQLVRAKVINLRQLYKPVKHRLPSMSEPIARGPFGDNPRSPIPYLNRSLELLISLFSGGRKEFIAILEGIKDRAGPENELLKEQSHDSARFAVLLNIMQGHEPGAESKPTHRTFYAALIQHIKGLDR